MPAEKLFISGHKTLTVAMVNLSGGSPLSQGVRLRARHTNVPDIYVKSVDHANSVGYILEPDYEVFIEIDSLSKIWVQAMGAGACEISWMAV